MTSDNEIEKEIGAKGLTAPRVTLAHIENTIDWEYYFTADNVLPSATPVIGAGKGDPRPSLRCLTFCVLVLKNGFTVTGENACASPQNFDAELGRKVARQNAVNKVWMLEGYLLKERLFNDASVSYGPSRTKEG